MASREKIITQRLISELNEEENGIAKIARVVNALISQAADGNVHAIKEIFDRVEGKAPQPIEGSDDHPLRFVFEWKPGQSPSITPLEDNSSRSMIEYSDSLASLPIDGRAKQ